MTQVTRLIPATRAMTGSLKATLIQAAQALEGTSLTVALRDNGPKVNGTMVFIEGNLGAVGDVFNAVKDGAGAYGPHLVLGTIEYAVTAEGKVSIVPNPENLIDIGLKTSAPVFQVQA